MKLKKISLYTLLTFAVLFLAWIAYGYFSVYNIEMPKYEVLEQKDGYELRKYDGYLAAYTEVQADNWDEASRIAFQRLGGFIFGDNTIVGEKVSDQIAMTAPVIVEEGVEKIAMTAPVIFEQGDERLFRMTFTMPSQFTKETLPKPNSPFVKIIEVEPYTVAALQYSGFYRESTIAQKKKELLEKVQADGYEVEGSPSFAGYNAPWTPPFMRRNEVWVRIK